VSCDASRDSEPEIVHRSCPFCEASCGLVLEVDRARQSVIAIRGDEGDPRSGGYLCPKSLALEGVHQDADRIRRPLRRTATGWEEISWGEALDQVGSRLREIRARNGKHAIATYIGNPTGHDFGAMLYTTLFIQALDTERVFTGATVDQFPKNLSCRLMYGDSWLFPIPDIDRTDFFLVLGANPLVSNGSLMSAPNMRARLRAHRERGGVLVVVDPRRTETAAIADRHLAIRPGADAYLLFALIHVLFDEGLVAPGRIADFTDGIERIRELAQDFPPEAVTAASGIAAEDIRGLARDFAAAEHAVCYGRFGTCTQEFGTLTSWLVDVVNILTGNFDRPGGSMFPRAATGQTEPVAEDSGPVPYGRFRSRVRGFPEFDGQLPAACMAEEIDSAGDERVRAMITVAGNPVLSTPNGARLAKALEQLDFMVSIDIYMNETTRLADVILPTTTQLEHANFDFLFQTTSVRNMVRYSPQVFAAPEGSKHHWELLLEVAARLNETNVEALDDLMVAGAIATFVGKPGTRGADASAEEARQMIGERRGPERLLDLLLRAGPYGDGFVEGAEGLCLEKLRKTPRAVDLGPLAPRLPGLLRTPGRRIQLIHAILVEGVAELRRRLPERGRDDRMLLVGRRQMCNMNSWLHNIEVLARGRNRCTLLIHPEDASNLGIRDGESARVRSRVGEVVVEATVSDEMRPGVVSLPHGFGHNERGTRLSVAKRRQPGVNSNLLTDELALDALSGTSVLSGIPVAVEPA
jgi:anaerobic selenocysteine-containing dehydrogenase